jgi:hypothetical protein
MIPEGKVTIITPTYTPGVLDPPDPYRIIITNCQDCVIGAGGKTTL